MRRRGSSQGVTRIGSCIIGSSPMGKILLPIPGFSPPLKNRDVLSSWATGEHLSLSVRISLVIIDKARRRDQMSAESTYSVSAEQEEFRKIFHKVRNPGEIILQILASS